MPYAAFALRTLAPTVWIMAYLGVFRGYFQGQGTMVPTAFSQVFEQIVNAIVSVAAGSFLFNEALKTEVLKNQTGDGYSNAWGAAGGTIGTGAGAFYRIDLPAVFICSLRKDEKAPDQERPDGDPGELQGHHKNPVLHGSSGHLELRDLQLKQRAGQRNPCVQF